MKQLSLKKPDDADTSNQDMQPERHDPDDSDEPGAAADVPAPVHEPLRWESLGAMLLMQARDKGDSALTSTLICALLATPVVEDAENTSSFTAWPKQPILAMLKDAERPDQPALMPAVGRPDWNAQDRFDKLRAGLWFFAPVGSLEPMVQTLHTWGWDLDAPDSSGQTVLMQASQKGHKNAVKLLLKAKAHLHVATPEKHNVLMIAVEQDQPEMVQLLLSAAMTSVDTASEDAADFPAHVRAPIDFNGLGLTHLIRAPRMGDVSELSAAQATNEFELPLAYAYFRITQAAAGGKAGNGLDETYAQAWDAENAVLCGLETTTDL